MTAMAMTGRSFIDRFKKWWRAELSGALRDLARFRKNNSIEFSLNENGELVYDQHRLQDSSLNEACLILDDRLFLKRKVTLPLSARKNLAVTLGYEFSRYFPVEKEAVVYSYTVPVITPGNLETEVWAIKKDRLSHVIDSVQGMRSRKFTYLSVKNSSNTICIEQQALSNNSFGITTQKYLLHQVVFPLLLVVFLLSLPVIKLAYYNYSLAARIETKTQELQQVISMHTEILAAEQKVTEILAEKNLSVSVAGKLSRITEVIDGKALVKSLSVDGNKFIITGTTQNMPGLVQAVKNVAVADSVVTTNGRTLLKQVPFEVSFVYSR